MTVGDVPKSSAPGGTLGSVGAYQLLERLPLRRGVREYLARQRGPGGFERICTLKLASRGAADRRAAESLEREAKVMMRLDHPNVVRFHDFFEHEGDIVLVLEHFSGLTLARLLDLVRERREPPDDCITWHLALALFDALAHAHGLVDAAGTPSPIIHRDVRPENILIASNGRVRLTGFAAAQDADSNEEITAFGAVISVPSYVAPEQVRGLEATERSDVYAAALVVWEMLSGRSATPEGLSEFELLKKLSERRVEPLRGLRADIPALVTTALDLCLTPDPEDRRIRCEEVAGCLTAGLEMGDGGLALRETIARLGPTVEKLAGGKVSSAPASRRRSSGPPLPYRPEAITLPEQVRISPRMEAAVTAIPLAPAQTLSVVRGPSSSGAFDERTEVIPLSPLVDDEDITEDAVELSEPAADRPGSSPAPGLVASTPSDASADSMVDDELMEMGARDKRRRVIRFVVIGVPVAFTVILLLAALLGVGGGSERVGVPATATTQSAQPHSGDRSAVVPLPAASVEPPPPADQAVLVVEGPPAGFVYVTGISLGATDTRIVTDCGQRFIRVGSRMGTEGLSSVRWLAKGQSLSLTCGQTTVVPADPDRKP